MSDVPRARALIRQALAEGMIDVTSRRLLRRALKLMVRVPYTRRAPAKHKVIDKFLRRRIHTMLHDNPDMTMHEIANVVGLRSGGRISEVAHGKR